MTYATLKTEIGTLSHRSDLTSSIPDFITRAEDWMFRELMPIEIEDEATGTITGNVIALPADFMAIQSLAIDDNPAYTIQSGQIEFIDEVADGTEYTLYYSARLTNLSDSNTTNWLLTYGHDLYVAAAMVELARHTRNTELEMKYTALLPSLVDSVRSYSVRKKFPVRGGLQIKPRR